MIFPVAVNVTDKCKQHPSITKSRELNKIEYTLKELSNFTSWFAIRYPEDPKGLAAMLVPL
jgi:hypothetical protein